MAEPDNLDALAHDAGRLLAFAVQPRLSPTSVPDYAALLDRYQREPLFRDLTRAVFRGAGLEIGAESLTFGLIVVATRDGPFLSKMRDFRESPAVKERVAYGLLLYLLAAYVFPTAESIDAPLEEWPPVVELPTALKHMLSVCEHVRANAPNGEVIDEKLTLGVEHLLTYREVSRGNDRSNLSAMLKRVCDHHLEAGLFQIEPTRNLPSTLGGTAGEAAPIYRPRPHYRVHVRAMAQTGHQHLLAFFQRFASNKR